MKIEVKGLSEPVVNVILTENECEKLKEYKENGYILAVVTNCLKAPYQYIFEYLQEKKCWINEDKDILNFEEAMTRCTLKSKG